VLSLSPALLILSMKVNDLERMFKEKFRYNVEKRSLNAVPGKSAKVLLQKYISDVVLEIDAPSSLLIIYYAGHGNPGENGDIIMTGYVHSTNLGKTKINLHKEGIIILGIGR
jgi:hypothetical protein